MPNRLIAALSFEDRSTCGMSSLESEIAELLVLDYGSSATPGPAARRARDDAWVRVQHLDHSGDRRLSRIDINPYSMRDLEEVILEGGADVHTYIDLSCLTRPHVVAAANACVELTRLNRPWSVIYTTPLSYGNIGDAAASFGWRDTLILPIGPEPSAANEGVSLGLVLLGQEAERLQIALDEVEPAAGYAVYVRRHDRPDLFRRTLAANDLVLRHLRSLRMPGRRADAIRPEFPALGWAESGISMDNLLSEMRVVIDDIIAAARAAEAPIFLYPFGPKLAGFTAALRLASRYPEASWCVYPIAITHPLDYSEGCASVAVISAATF